MAVTVGAGLDAAVGVVLGGSLGVVPGVPIPIGPTIPLGVAVSVGVVVPLGVAVTLGVVVLPGVAVPLGVADGVGLDGAGDRLADGVGVGAHTMHLGVIGDALVAGSGWVAAGRRGGADSGSARSGDVVLCTDDVPADGPDSVAEASARTRIVTVTVVPTATSPTFVVTVRPAALVFSGPSAYVTPLARVLDTFMALATPGPTFRTVTVYAARPSARTGVVVTAVTRRYAESAGLTFPAADSAGAAASTAGATTTGKAAKIAATRAPGLLPKPGELMCVSPRTVEAHAVRHVGGLGPQVTTQSL